VTSAKKLLTGVLLTQAAAAAVLLALPSSPEPRRSEAAESPPAQDRVDIGRLTQLQDRLPAGFTADVRPTQTISQRSVDDVAASLKAFTVDPPECVQAAADISQTVGATVTALAVRDDRFGFVINAAQTLHPTAVAPPVLDTCRDFTIVRPDGSVSETRVIAAPHIADAITSATHSIQTIDDPATGKTHAVDQYLYSARLDDSHLVTVVSLASPVDSAAAAQQAEQFLIDAVNTVRRPS
jgi:Domain of unknown function (DUF5642)